MATGQPPTLASQATTVSPPIRSGQRSSGAWSWSATARITVADVEGQLALWVDVRGEDVADGQDRAAVEVVRECLDVAVGRIAGRRPAREPLSGSDVGVVVVRQQHADRARQVRGPVLTLPVRSHDPLVAADAEVVLGRDAARVVERLLSGEHHRAVGRHHEDALGVHEHRRLGVPVRLGADVDPGDDDVDLVAGLGELDEPAEHGGDPVHVLGAAVHRDAGTGGKREPLERHAERLGEVEGGDDAPALRLGQRAEGLGGVTEEGDADHALRVAVGRRW